MKSNKAHDVESVPVVDVLPETVSVLGSCKSFWCRSTAEWFRKSTTWETVSRCEGEPRYMPMSVSACANYLKTFERSLRVLFKLYLLLMMMMMMMMMNECALMWRES